MRRILLVALLFSLVGCSTESRSPTREPQSWDAPPARWVSDLGRFEERYTYNESSSVSNGGRWVVLSSHVKERPPRIFLINTATRRIRQLDDAYDGGPRVSPGVRRFNVAGLDPQVTPDGRFVVFSSEFSNIVRNDRNDAIDIFLYDRRTRKTEIVSRSTNGSQANLGSSNPSVSANGRFLVFDSRATNLAPDDHDARSDVFRRDLRTGKTDLVSIGAGGKSDGSSNQPDISADGSRVSFLSDAGNLVQDDTNALHDVFVRDIRLAETVRVSVTSDGGEYESFESEESASVHHASVGEPRISDDGEVVVFRGNANRLVPEDVNYSDDIFVHDLAVGVTERVSVRSDGGDAYDQEGVECGKNPVCGQFVGMHSPSVSHDGTLVYFISAAPLLSDEDEDSPGGSTEDIFVRDRSNGVTLLVSRYRDGSPAESSNWYPGEISADGLWVTYSTNSMKLDGPAGDQDPGPDVFLQNLPE